MVITGFITEEQCAHEKSLPLSASLAISPTLAQDEEALLVGKTKSTPSVPPRHAGAPYRAPYFVSEVLYQLRDICGPEVGTPTR
jgi:hypothetical protein